MGYMRAGIGLHASRIGHARGLSRPGSQGAAGSERPPAPVPPLRTPLLLLIDSISGAWLRKTVQLQRVSPFGLRTASHRSWYVCRVGPSNALQASDLEFRCPALRSSRQLARFLCGIASPAATRAKLKNHPAFATLSDVPFATVLDAVKQ